MSTDSSLAGVTVLVAGAGDTYFGQLHEISTDDFEQQVQIHLIGANRLVTAVVPDMVERRRGDVIFVGSDVSLRPRPHMGGYGAAKAGLLAMARTLQMELEGTGVRASVVHPGPTKTAMGWSADMDKVGAMLEDWAKWGQARHDYFLRAADLARAITFDSHAITGVAQRARMSPGAQAAITLRTTAAFEESVSGFVAITLALTEGQLGDMVSGGLETPDLDECIWASFEAAAIDPQLGAMSQEVAVFLSDLQNSEVMDPEEQVEDSDDFPKQLDDLLQQLFAIGLPAEQIEEIVQRGLLAISDEQNQISG